MKVGAVEIQTSLFQCLGLKVRKEPAPNGLKDEKSLLMKGSLEIDGLQVWLIQHSRNLVVLSV